MSISALPDSTKQRLGASLVVTSPTALVKELLDNAIDAKATVIEVLISPNTIDKIEVRDNGVGIHPDDYDSLGRAGHTSKLKRFEEPDTIAGSILGFRGQALASVNVVAKISVTTRTTSDPVAAVLHIIPKSGGVLEQKAASAPVGTTVTVTGLFSGIPVREQRVSKESSKTLDQIKELFRSYAMARPQLKLIFKVFKTPGHNWTYTPKRDAGVREVALQLFGVGLGAQCFEKTAEFGTAQESRITPGVHQFLVGQPIAFEAVMLKPDCGSLQFPKHRYLSVDGRPVSGSKGMMKKLVEIYCKYLRSALGTSGTAISTADVFICLNIRCPTGSYDVNIEPSKDDVLFEDEARILNHFEAFCKESYGPLQSSTTISTNIPRQSRSENNEFSGASNLGSSPGQLADQTQEAQSATPAPPEPTDPMNLMGSVRRAQELEPKEAGQESLVRQPNGSEKRPTERRPSTQAGTHRNLHNASQIRDLDNVYEVDGRAYQRRGTLRARNKWESDMSIDLNENTENQRSKKRLKPSRPLVERQTDLNEQQDLPELPLNPWSIARMNAQMNANTGQRPQLHPLTQHDRGAVQDVPMTPEPELLRHPGAPPRDLDIPPSHQYRHLNGERNVVHNAVPGGVYRSPLSSPAAALPRASRLQNMRDEVSRRAQPPWTPPSSIWREQEEWKNMYNLRPRQARASGPEGLKQTTLSFGGSTNLRKVRSNEAVQQQTENLAGDGQPLVNDRVDRQDFALQEFNLRSSAPYLDSTEAQMRRKAAEDKEPIKPSLPTGDPRAYLLRRQKSVAADDQTGRPKKFRRLKSSLLPLENTPPDDSVRCLIFPVALDVATLPEVMELVERYDRYVVEGDVEEGLDIDLGEGRRVEERLNALLTEWNQEFTGERTEVECHLSAQLKGKAVVSVV